MSLKKFYLARLALVALLGYGTPGCGGADEEGEDAGESPGPDTSARSDADGDSDGEGDGEGDGDSDSDGDSDGEGAADTETDSDTGVDMDALAPFERYVLNSNRFGLDLFGILAGDDSDHNIAFSPVSVAAALGMTYAGARGNTALEMASVLHNELDDEAFIAARGDLAAALGERSIPLHEVDEGGSKGLELSLVNGAWVQEGFEVSDAYLDRLSEGYESEVTSLDIAGDPDGATETINDWVAEMTHQRIPDLIPPNVLSSLTPLVLANALYFKGSWAETFPTEMTETGTFHTPSGEGPKVPMMRLEASLPYYEEDGCLAVSLPYDGGEIEMIVVLPEEGRFAEVRDRLDAEWLWRLTHGKMANREIHLTMPRFHFTWGTKSLVEPLKVLGMEDAFDEMSADFKGIYEPGGLYVGEVFHQAFFSVDEHGTEATAATAVVMYLVVVGPPTTAVIVDRPFLFFVRDATGAILFAGQVIDPSKGEL